LKGDGPVDDKPKQTFSRRRKDDSRKKLGMCNFCAELGPVYEQEDEYRALFLVCLRCVKDVMKRLDMDGELGERF
jgi:hypothetical protein